MSRFPGPWKKRMDGGRVIYERNMRPNVAAVVVDGGSTHREAIVFFDESVWALRERNRRARVKTVDDTPVGFVTVGTYATVKTAKAMASRYASHGLIRKSRMDHEDRDTADFRRKAYADTDAPDGFRWEQDASHAALTHDDTGIVFGEIREVLPGPDGRPRWKASAPGRRAKLFSDSTLAAAAIVRWQREGLRQNPRRRKKRKSKRRLRKPPPSKWTKTPLSAKLIRKGAIAGYMKTYPDGARGAITQYASGPSSQGGIVWIPDGASFTDLKVGRTSAVVRWNQNEMDRLWRAGSKDVARGERFVKVQQRRRRRRRSR